MVGIANCLGSCFQWAVASNAKDGVAVCATRFEEDSGRKILNVNLHGGGTSASSWLAQNSGAKEDHHVGFGYLSGKCFRSIFFSLFLLCMFTRELHSSAYKYTTELNLQFSVPLIISLLEDDSNSPAHSLT